MPTGKNYTPQSGADIMVLSMEGDEEKSWKPAHELCSWVFPLTRRADVLAGRQVGGVPIQRVGTERGLRAAISCPGARVQSDLAASTRCGRVRGRRCSSAFLVNRSWSLWDNVEGDLFRPDRPKLWGLGGTSHGRGYAASTCTLTATGSAALHRPIGNGHYEDVEFGDRCRYYLMRRCCPLFASMISGSMNDDLIATLAK